MMYRSSVIYDVPEMRVVRGKYRRPEIYAVQRGVLESTSHGGSGEGSPEVFDVELTYRELSAS
jgi:hypothetical protein